MRGARIVVVTSTLVLLSSAWAGAQQPKKPGSAPAQATIQDEDPQAKSIREQYEAQMRRERRLVSISVRNATPQEVIEEFRIQTELNFVFDPRNFPEDYRIEEFVLKNVQVRRALEEFARVIEATLEFVTPTLVRISRPPRLTFNFRARDNTEW